MNKDQNSLLELGMFLLSSNKDHYQVCFFYPIATFV